MATDQGPVSGVLFSGNAIIGSAGILRGVGQCGPLLWHSRYRGGSRQW